MPVLHHVSMHPQHQDGWDQLLLCVCEGDVVILLDHAVRHLPAVASLLASVAPRISCRVPEVEMAADRELPLGIECIADGDWWQMIAECPNLLEWT